MKKYWIIFATVLGALLSCEKQQDLLPDSAQEDGIIFNLTANYTEDGPQTAAVKSVKTGWESGDVIFVFLDKVAAPKYIRMSYNGTQWTTTLMNGSESVTAFGLTDAQKSGSMRAVYLPFGSTASVSADSEVTTQFNFSKAYSTYYLTDTKSYTVSAQNTVNVAFSMSIPTNYVQFFVTDSSASDEAYFLATDAVRPVVFTGVAANGDLVLTPGNAGDNMPGYAYGSGANKGNLFSGELIPAYNTTYGSNYYLALSENKSSGKRFDLFVTPDDAIASHDAVKLPNLGSERWQEVGPSVAVSLQVESTDCGTWATCNVTSSTPEGLPLHNYTGASSHEDEDFKLPTNAQFTLLNSPTWIWLSVHGTQGYVLKSDTGFLFLPVTNNELIDDQFYWGATAASGAYIMTVNSSGHDVSTTTSLTQNHSARLIKVK